MCNRIRSSEKLPFRFELKPLRQNENRRNGSLLVIHGTWKKPKVPKWNYPIYCTICSHPGLPAAWIYNSRLPFQAFGKVSAFPTLPKAIDIAWKVFLWWVQSRHMEALYDSWIVWSSDFVLACSVWELPYSFRMVIILLPVGVYWVIMLLRLSWAWQWYLRPIWINHCFIGLLVKKMRYYRRVCVQKRQKDSPQKLAIEVARVRFRTILMTFICLYCRFDSAKFLLQEAGCYCNQNHREHSDWVECYSEQISGNHRPRAVLHFANLVQDGRHLLSRTKTKFL